MVLGHLDPERWRRIQCVFHEALALPADERAGFLERSSRGDPALLEHVSALLAADAAPSPVLDHPPLAGIDPEGAPDPPFDRIGPYVLEERLGAGAMGVVYRARDTRLDRLVALKLLPAQPSNDPAERRFRMEALAASRLDHPHICAIHDVGRAPDGRPFIVFGYYRGPTLAKRLREGPLPVPEAVEVAQQMADALAAAHERGVVHRDIKPSNVLLAEVGGAKLLDFGIARLADADLTHTDATPGTPAYMSPEQVRGEPADERSDLWSLGVVLYEMLSGHRPWEADTRAGLVYDIVHGAPEPLEKRCPDLPRPLADLVHRLLARDPADRFPDAATVVAASRSPDSVTRPPPEGWRRGGTPLAVGIGLIAIGALLFPALDRGGLAPEDASVAVLPFTALGGETETDYFSEGLTDELLTILARVEGVRVPARASVFALRDQTLELPEVARRLGVAHVVEGRVRRQGDRVRIAVQLVRLPDATPVWSEVYDRRVDDVFDIQAEIARAIVSRLRTELGTGQAATGLAPERTDAEAYEEYLKGRYFWYQRNPEAIGRAAAAFEGALEIDPGYAPALVGLAEVRARSVWYGGPSPQEAFPAAARAARQALFLDSTQAQAHVVLGLVESQYHGDADAAEAEFRAALRLEPDNAEAHHALGQFLATTGRMDEGVPHLERALRFDPLSPVLAVDLATAFFFARRYDEAERRLEAVLRAHPDFALAYVFLGMTREEQGRSAQAIADLRRAIELGGRSPLWLAVLARAHASAGNAVTARALLREVAVARGDAYASPMASALVHAALGDTAQARALLRQAEKQRDPYFMTYGEQHPQLDGLRPRGRR